MRDTRPVIVPLGGFLGAGKTTLILAASRILQSRGMRPAAILNDQGSELVDTHAVGAAAIAADQVTGGCFCCRFSDLIDAAHRLHAHAPDVIFAEAVGSCTDISATTLQPLKLYYGHEFRLAPYSVLVDPQRAREFTAADPAGDLPFLFRTQLDEADLICFTKSDLHHDVSGPQRCADPISERGHGPGRRRMAGRSAGRRHPLGRQDSGYRLRTIRQGRSGARVAEHERNGDAHDSPLAIIFNRAAARRAGLGAGGRAPSHRASEAVGRSGVRVSEGLDGRPRTRAARARNAQRLAGIDACTAVEHPGRRRTLGAAANRRHPAAEAAGHMGGAVDAMLPSRGSET